MLHDLFSVFAIFTFLELWLVFIKGPLIYARILYWNRRILHFSVLVTWLDVCQNNAILLLFSITEFEFCYTVNISFPLRMVIQGFLRLYKVSVYRQSSSKDCVIYFYINFLLL